MPFNFPVISEDGYIRLSFPKLEAIRLIHMISGLDEYAPEIVSAGAISTAITGYTEWISNTSPAITIGWDWQLETISSPVSLKRISEPRSNIMLEDAGKRDMGPVKTAALLEIIIDTLDWQIAVMDHIDLRYSAVTP